MDNLKNKKIVKYWKAPGVDNARFIQSGYYAGLENIMFTPVFAKIKKVAKIRLMKRLLAMEQACLKDAAQFAKYYILAANEE